MFSFAFCKISVTLTNALCALFFSKRKLEGQRCTEKPAQVHGDQPEQCYPSLMFATFFALNPKYIKMPPWKSCYKMAFPCSVTLYCPLEISGLHTQSTPIDPTAAVFHSPKGVPERCTSIVVEKGWREGDKTWVLNPTLHLLWILSTIKGEIRFMLLANDGLGLWGLRKATPAFFFFKVHSCQSSLCAEITFIAFSPQTSEQPFYKEQKLKYWRISPLMHSEFAKLHLLMT